MILLKEKQWYLLWKIGIFLTHHLEADKKFSLYALYAFFVEVELDPKTDKIIGMGHFKTGEELYKYVGNIDINKI
ncbi:hypothetical protein CLV91_1939 [Maribacter vaceletii]|uniref:Uncharacterized protein n=1 Tax=Maribacter vaceletii TaxID=1206816 RepID=A0A495E8G3_9FLAO|nr:hypothetical protein [Maribacter vaceletii]RKR13224.1 hypothetical protein CLV91_1939 [Maribacter vaceletii]